MRSAKAPFGAILAGGQSRRYGSPKALAVVAGARLIDRVARVLEQVTPDLVLLANEPDIFADLQLPVRADVRPGLGALGGIHTGLLWAREEGRPGILAVACDLPFPCLPLLERVRDQAFGHADAGRYGEPDGPDLVVPESRGRRGVEPLFAAYRVDCLPAIENQIRQGDHRMIGFFDQVRTRRIPLARVEELCDPGRSFLNVNTAAERRRAERLARSDDFA